jgi:hypothetical protein
MKQLLHGLFAFVWLNITYDTWEALSPATLSLRIAASMACFAVAVWFLEELFDN